MNIVLTGASGFVGNHLSKYLSQNNVIHYIVRKKSNNNKNTYSWNDLDNVKWNEIDAIIHLAGKAHDTKNVTDDKIYYETNVGLTKIIYDIFLRENIKIFIFFSSVKAVTDSLENEILTEKCKPNPKTPYGKSKLEAEKYILSKLSELNTKKDNQESNGKKIYILRPCMIHGPGNKGNLNLLYKFVSNGIPWPLGGYDNLRSFTSIDNILYVINNLLECDIKTGVYNISDDTPLSTNRMIEIISESSKKNVSILKINKNIIQWFAKINDMLSLPLNSERLKKLTCSYVVSNIKLKKELKITYLPIGAEEGMKKTIQSFISI